MSDVGFIILSVIVYLVFIRPLLRGVIRKPEIHDQQKTQIKKSQTPSEKENKTTEGEYVDYEEVK